MPVLLQKNSRLPLTDAESLIDERLRDGRPATFIHVVPTRRKVREAERRYLQSLPRRTAGRFNLFTLETLAVELYSLCCPLRRIVEGPSQAILFHQAILNVRSSLRYFRFPSGGRFLPQGTFQKIINVVNMMKEQGIYPSLLLMELSAADPTEQFKLRDIATIYEEYERLLGTRFIDPAGYLKLFNEEWNDESARLVRDHFKEVDLVVVSGFDKFSDPELTLLAALAGIPQFRTIVSFDYHGENDRLFGHLEDNYKKFLEIGFQKIPTARFSARPFTAHMADYCFSGKRNKLYDAQQEVTLLEVPTRRDEVELAARIIKKLALDQPELDISKICVAMYQPGPYTPLFREVFAGYGIPANITDRYSLNQSPLVLSLLSLLMVQERNFQLRDIMRALSSPYCRFDSTEERIDAGNLYEAAALLKVSGGKTAWISGCERRQNQIAQQLAVVDDDIEADHLLREQRSLAKAADDIKRLTALLAPFEHSLRPYEFREQLLSLFEQIRVREGLLPSSSLPDDAEQCEKDARAFQKFLYFIDDYMELLREEEGGSEPKPLALYLESLRAALPNVRYNIRQKWGYGVQVTTLEETRGIDADIMIIVGMVDGEFPPLYKPEIFFSNSRRAGVERFHLTEHRYLFYQAATNFRQHLYLIYPRRDPKRQLVPSSFLEALTSVVRIDDRRAAPPPELLDPLFSVGEYLRFTGASISDSGADLAGVITGDETIDQPLRMTLAHMRHAAEMERERFRGDARPEYNGRIGSGLYAEAKAALERFRGRVYSVTQLESYGRCPFQFFAGKVLRLNVMPEIEEGVPSSERGRLLHEILFEFYIGRRESKKPALSACTEGEFNDAIGDLIALAGRKFEQYSLTGVIWDLEKEWYTGGEGRKGVFREFLEYERSREYQTIPSFFEAGFGSHVGGRRSSDPGLTIEEPLRAGEVSLRGKIDRIDCGSGAIRIVDYKTGAESISKEDLELGISLQLPIYLYAVEKILHERGRANLRPAVGVQMKLRSPIEEEIVLANKEFSGVAFPEGGRTKKILPSEQELRATIEHAIDCVNSYVDNIAHGEFPVTPRKPEKVCPWCDFKKICRIGNAAEVTDGGKEL
jgi:ATP-dependent helicase/nuclease subunit B